MVASPPGTVLLRSPGPPDARGPATSAHPLRPWPLTALLALLPLWWLLGLSVLIFPVLATAMAAQLVHRRPVRFPPGFGIWLLFLGAVAVSTCLAAVEVPGTTAGSFSGRLPGIAFRLGQYVALTVVAVYAYNLTERELSRGRLVRLLGWLFVVTVAGGYLGLLVPMLDIASPVELLLPDRVAADPFVQSLVHPNSAQLQQVLGYAAPRPAAPFGYTNTWGNCLSVLMPFFVVSFVLRRGARHRLLAVAVLVAAVVPAVYSLNRGLWIGLAVTVLYVVVRSAAAGHVLAVGGIVAAVAVLLVAALTTPLASVFEQRLENGQSDSIRLFTTQQTVQVVTHSPVLGLGTTRAALGSSQSIAVGQSRECPLCGNPTIGSNGQLWLLLVSQGAVGLLLYCGFVLYGIWHFRADRSPLGMACVLVLCLSLVYMFVYNALVWPQCVYLLAHVLLSRAPVAGAALPRTAVPA